MHDGLVNQHNVERAAKVVSRLGSESLLRLSDKEPVLAEFINDSVTHIAGKMTVAGCDDRVVRGVFGDTLATMIIALEALRNGHYELWLTEVSTPIEADASPDDTEDSGG